MDAIKEKISSYLSSHTYLRLGTVSDDGTPVVSTVGFVNEGATVYFITDQETRKARNIRHNPSVAYSCDEDYADVAQIQGVQMKGRASMVTDPGQMQALMGRFFSKYPQLKEMPEKPGIVCFAVEPVEGYYLDNTVEFAHRDKTTY